MHLTSKLPLLFLAGCAAPTAVGAQPGLSPEARDRLQTELPAPEVEAFEALTTTQVIGHFDVPSTFVRDWFLALPLSVALPGTEDIPGVARTELLSPTWGGPWARRRVVLTDGGSALEQILLSELPDRFKYVVWNYDTSAAAYVRYGVGEFRFLDLAQARGVQDRQEGRSRQQQGSGRVQPQEPAAGLQGQKGVHVRHS